MSLDYTLNQCDTPRSSDIPVDEMSDKENISPRRVRVRGRKGKGFPRFSTLKVETIGYYHRDRNMEILLDALPCTINENRKYFENPEENPFPLTTWEIKRADLGGGEDFLDSLLEYIRLKGWPERNKPQFVTNRQSLKMIASTAYLHLYYIHAFRYDGVTFLIAAPISGIRETFDIRYPFEEFFTKNRENDCFVQEKAVFMAELTSSSKIMYSGQLHSILDETSKEPCEIKAIPNGISDELFLMWKTQLLFWQCHLSNAKTVVIGTQIVTEKENGKDNETLTISEVKKWSLLEIMGAVKQMAEAQGTIPKWNLLQGEQRLAEFFGVVENQVRYDGDYATFTYNNKTWKVSQDFEAIKPFAALIKSKLKAMASETSWMEEFLMMSLHPKR